MPSVISEITGWAKLKLKYWEQLDLHKIISGEEFEDVDYKDLLKNLLIDNGLFPEKSKRPKVSFKSFEKHDDDSKISEIKICEIKNFKNVNALVPEQGNSGDGEFREFYCAKLRTEIAIS